MQRKYSKFRIKPVPVIILAAVSVILVLSIIFFINSHSTKNKINIDIKKVTDLGNESGNDMATGSANNKPITVSIDMDSCAMYIGSSIKVTASVDPVETDKTVNWRSSDENVFTVDTDGVVSIKGKGTAALTATIGNASDAIVLEGIDNSDTASSQNGLPIFNLLANKNSTTNSANNVGTSNNSSGNASSSGGSNVSGGTGNVSGNTSSGNTSSGNINSGNTGASNTGSNNTGANTDGNTGSGSTGSGSTGGSSNSVNPSTGTVKSTDLPQNLSQLGYNQYMSNVFVYEENNTYYGEIIIQSNVTIIYIKQRSATFDSKIKNVIASLLPNDYEQVWNNYISATSDRTFSVGGRTVRIVTAVNGGHSQIVIYNN